LRLQIADNGQGIVSDRTDHGIGLEVMKHRASVIGADLEINTSPGGVTVTCTVPLKNK
jgi:signal transduction histidine kinase